MNQRDRTLIELGTVDNLEQLPAECLSTTITLAEPSVGPLVARTAEERAARPAHLLAAEADLEPHPSRPSWPGAAQPDPRDTQPADALRPDHRRRGQLPQRRNRRLLSVPTMRGKRYADGVTPSWWSPKQQRAIDVVRDGVMNGQVAKAIQPSARSGARANMPA